MAHSDLIFLMRNTVPVPGERGAVIESWFNVLEDAGLKRAEIRREQNRAMRAWDSRQSPYPQLNGEG